MNEAFRVSVRELVSFSFFAPDIVPSGGTEDMLAGTLAHQARQRAQAERYEIERTLKRELEREGERALVFGRMDAFADGDVPIVEEIKLCRQPPDEALAEHAAQARLYGALLIDEGGYARATLRVAYVYENGELARTFEETLDASTLTAFLDQLLLPWLAMAVRERDRALLRDESLRALHFPFDEYRAGQRELAVQVYTAVARKKRLFASLPTGTGKSAAVLFPALKAMGEGKTRKLLYLTARTTARQSPLNALELMKRQGLRARVMTLLAKEKLCPAPTRCHPDDCPRARGHFLRQPEAIDELLQCDEIWTDERITAAANSHDCCPFELALALVELADVVLLDLNYAFDPFAQLERVFKRRKDFTLLIDEAHHVTDRVRESLSGALDSRMFRESRTVFGKELGRKSQVYAAFSALLNALRAVEPPEPADVSKEGGAVLDDLSAAVLGAAQGLAQTLLRTLEERLSSELRQQCGALLRVLSPFLFAASNLSERYAILWEPHGKERRLELFCLSPAEHIASVTKGARGTVFFSATLSPLAAMKELLGGDEDDACFSLPSPFAVEHLAVVRRRVQTRYAYREQSARRVAESIAEAVGAHKGKYIAYFPSYAYLRLIAQQLTELSLPPMLVQESEMSEEARDRFLRAFEADEQPKLGLCVLGGLFAEGVDLPGDRLIGAMIVGVGLPTPSLRLKTLQAYYQRRFGDGFLYAWMIPAMQKVLQAGGRVIRTEEDRGLILLLDDRYFEPRYARLLPPEWRLVNEDIAGAVRALYGE